MTERGKKAEGPRDRHRECFYLLVHWPNTDQAKAWRRELPTWVAGAKNRSHHQLLFSCNLAGS